MKHKKIKTIISLSAYLQRQVSVTGKSGIRRNELLIQIQKIDLNPKFIRRHFKKTLAPPIILRNVRHTRQNGPFPSLIFPLKLELVMDFLLSQENPRILANESEESANVRQKRVQKRYLEVLLDVLVVDSKVGHIFAQIGDLLQN